MCFIGVSFCGYRSKYLVNTRGPRKGKVFEDIRSTCKGRDLSYYTCGIIYEDIYFVVIMKIKYLVRTKLFSYLFSSSCASLFYTKHFAFFAAVALLVDLCSEFLTTPPQRIERFDRRLFVVMKSRFIVGVSYQNRVFAKNEI